MTERDLTDYELGLIDYEMGLTDCELDQMTDSVIDKYDYRNLTTRLRKNAFKTSIQPFVSSVLAHRRFGDFMRQCDGKLTTKLLRQSSSREECEKAKSLFTEMVNLCCNTSRTRIARISHRAVLSDRQLEILRSLKGVSEILDDLERERNQQYGRH